MDSGCDAVRFYALGQYVGSLLVQEADTMIVEQTNEMWNQTRQLHEQIKKEKKFDSLTGLPNASLFLEKLDILIRKDPATQSTGSLIRTLSGYINSEQQLLGNTIILLDIDNFKEINNTMGSHNGDTLLQLISERLRGAFDEQVTISRIGGDDFGLIIPGNSDGVINKASKKVRDLFKNTFDIHGVAIMVDTSIGISLFPQHGDSAKTLLQNAEIAMYACKRKAKQHVVYDPSLNIHDLNDLLLKSEIKQAFDNNELILHYQPKSNIFNQIHEVEALVRWIHPTKGMIPPDVFIPIILGQRLNGKLLLRILDISLAQAKKWEQEGIKLRIALNLTAFDLLDPRLPDIITEKLEQYRLSTDVLKLEITETTLVENQQLTLKTLTRLSAMGLPVSIDDFGTGYSSLAYLSSLPINEVKIDRSFVTDMPENHRNQKIIQAIIALAHSLSLSTVAEGVENIETLNQLKNIDCDFIQGYFISKPLNGDDLTTWLKDWNKKSTPTLLKTKEA